MNFRDLDWNVFDSWRFMGHIFISSFYLKCTLLHVLCWLLHHNWLHGFFLLLQPYFPHNFHHHAFTKHHQLSWMAGLIGCEMESWPLTVLLLIHDPTIFQLLYAPRSFWTGLGNWKEIGICLRCNSTMTWRWHERWRSINCNTPMPPHPDTRHWEGWGHWLGANKLRKSSPSR